MRVALSCVVMMLLAPAVARPEPTWYRARTKHFTLYSADARNTVRDQARELERMVQVIALTGLGSESGDHPRTVIIAFPNHRSFEPHIPVVGDRPLNIAGYVTAQPFGHWIGYEGDDPRGRSVEFHEYTHTIVAEVFSRVPSCLNEGLAEFFSTFEMEEDVVRYGFPMPGHNRTLLEMEPLSMDELFASQPGTGAMSDPERMHLFYAESWALVHMLATQNGGTARFLEFVQSIANATSARAAFQAAYPDLAWDGMPSRLRSYVDTGHMGVFERKLTEPLAEDAVEVDAAPPGEVPAQVGLWRSYEKGLDRSETAHWFDDALARSPDLPLARAGQGVLALLDDRDADAAGRFAAVATSASDAEALSISGIGLIIVGRKTEKGGEAWVKQGEQTLRRVLAIDAHDAMAREWLAESDAASHASAARDSAAGAVRAHNFAVDDYNRGVEAANHEDYEAAVKFFQQARDGGEGDLRDAAEQRLRELAGAAEYKKGMDAAGRKDYTTALTWLRQADSLAVEPQRKAATHEAYTSLKAYLAPKKKAGAAH